jgi:hypothetical protein
MLHPRQSHTQEFDSKIPERFSNPQHPLSRKEVREEREEKKKG